MSTVDHNERGGFGCLTAADSGIPNVTDEPGKIHQCSCGRWWILREVIGLVVWQPMTDADKALHLPGELSARDLAGRRTYETPGEVCMGCSDPRIGRWVPVSQCQLAMTAFDDGSAFYRVMDTIRGDFE